MRSEGGRQNTIGVRRNKICSGGPRMLPKPSVPEGKRRNKVCSGVCSGGGLRNTRFWKHSGIREQILFRSGTSGTLGFGGISGGRIRRSLSPPSECRCPKRASDPARRCPGSFMDVRKGLLPFQETIRRRIVAFAPIEFDPARCPRFHRALTRMRYSTSDAPKLPRI